jgi:hypothetical protein
MRPAKLALVSLAILAIYALRSSAILDGGLGLNADQLIDQSNGNYVINLGIPENPQASRKIWSEESGINFSKIGNLSNGASATPQESRSSAQTESGMTYQTESNVRLSQGQTDANSYQVSSSDSTSQSNSKETAETSFSLTGASPLTSAKSLAGNWSFRLKDSKNRILVLGLFASESSVFGAGTMNDGGDTMKASASGMINSAGNLSLDVTTSGSVSLYKLDMAVNDTMTLGEYRAFSQEGETWKGIVEGRRRQ